MPVFDTTVFGRRERRADRPLHLTEGGAPLPLDIYLGAPLAEALADLFAELREGE